MGLIYAEITDFPIIKMSGTLFLNLYSLKIRLMKAQLFLIAHFSRETFAEVVCKTERQQE